MTWKIEHQKPLIDAKVFKLEEVKFKESPIHYSRIVSNDWVNVLPITADKKAVMIKQFSAGVMQYTLEVPGGMFDGDEKDATMVAARELEEETGYTSMRILPLATLNSNPAILSNKLHMFLALNCQLSPDRKHFPDESENIEIELVDYKELEGLVRTGRIDHSLSALTIMLALKYLYIK